MTHTQENNGKQKNLVEHSDYQPLRVGGSECTHKRALARVSELVVVVVGDGVKADSEVSEAGCDSSPPFET